MEVLLSDSQRNVPWDTSISFLPLFFFLFKYVDHTRFFKIITLEYIFILLYEWFHKFIRKSAG